MYAVNFKQVNKNFTSPVNEETGEEIVKCFDLPVCQTYTSIPEGDFSCTISKWQPDEMDIINIINGSGIWLTLFGHSVPPQRIDTKSPFQDDEAIGVEHHAMLLLVKSLLNKLATIAKEHGSIKSVEVSNGNTGVRFTSGALFTLDLTGKLIYIK
jgi:hypothetical protein